MKPYRVRKAFLVLSIAGAATLGSATPSQAATCNVPSGTHPTIQSAIDDGATPCDPIVVAPGTYAEALSINTRGLTLQGAGPGLTILSPGATQAMSVGSIGMDFTVNISGFAVGGTGLGIGLLSGDTLNLSNSTVTGHNGTIGAGINISGTATFVGSNLTIANNTTSAAGGGGAGILNGGSVTLSDSTISGNNAAGSGAGFRNTSTGASATLTNVTFFNNRANGDGGNYMSASSGATATLNNVTLARGIADDNADNTGDGGGFYSQGGTTTLANTIIADNTDETPLAVNGQAHDCSVSAGTLSRAGYVLVEDATATFPALGCTYSGTDVATGYQTGVDPLLAAALGSNGGPTQTLALNTGSVAINTGNPATPGSGASPICAATDQRGLPRGGAAGVCDLGAFEVQPVPPVVATPAPVAIAPTPQKRKKKCKKRKKRRGAAAAKKCKKRKKRR